MKSLNKIKKNLDLKKNQKGATLILVIIILIVLLIGAIALIRSTSTTTTASGNFAVKESAILASDVGLKLGKDYASSITNKDVDSSPQYYATRQPEDSDGLPTSINWSVVPSTTVNNVQVQYVVDRLCTSTPVTNASNQCYVAQNSSTSGGSYRSGQVQILNGQIALYYRITVKITGNRGLQTFVQAMVSA